MSILYQHCLRQTIDTESAVSLIVYCLVSPHWMLLILIRHPLLHVHTCVLTCMYSWDSLQVGEGGIWSDQADSQLERFLDRMQLESIQ
jgi:hypothetical protein